LNTDTDEPSTYSYEARGRTEKSGFDFHEEKRDFQFPATPYPVFVTVGTRGSLCGGKAVRATLLLYDVGKADNTAAFFNVRGFSYLNTNNS
jgi:hypothetical protein